MKLHVMTLTPDEFSGIAERAHLVMFDELRPKEMNRIDFALLVEDAETKKPVGYGTYRELDSTSVYMQYGGCFPNTQLTTWAFPVYKAAIDTLQNRGYKYANTLIENTNISMLKFAFKVGFRVIGVRMFEGKIFCELLRNFHKDILNA